MSLLDSEGTPLDPARPELGRYSLSDESELRVDVPLDAWACTAALRALLATVVYRQGGLLLHASGVVWGNRAVVAFGPSGAGKSTLARTAVASAGAELLSDETIGLLPDGRVAGSPFWSDEDLVGTVREGTLCALLVLEKGSSESVAPVGSAESTVMLLRQCYRLRGSGVSTGELLRRVSRLLSTAPVRTFTFRKAPEAGLFLRDWTASQD